MTIQEIDEYLKVYRKMNLNELSIEETKEVLEAYSKLGEVVKKIVLKHSEEIECGNWLLKL